MKLRASLAGVALALGGLAPIAAAPAACAQERPRAALVVDAGDDGGVYRMCVALPDDSVTGLELIQLAGEQFGLQYRLGHGGGAVCMLAGVGFEQDDCLQPGQPFWAYWHGDGSGGWVSSGTGAGSYVVGDGDVEGWSWGSGESASSHQPPPATVFASVCKPLERTSPPPGKAKNPSSTTPAGPTSRGSDGGSPRSGPTAADRSASRQGGEADEKRRGDVRPDQDHDRRSSRSAEAGLGRRRELAEASSFLAGLPPRARDVRRPRRGPPAAGVAGVLASLSLAGAGVVFMRRRRSARTV